MRFVTDIIAKLSARVFAPQPIVRLELVRMLAPLAILGFLSSRLVHAPDWLSTDAFHVPALGSDWRQPVNLPPVSPTTAWLIAIALLVAALAVAAGALTRWSTVAFAALMVYVTLADRLEAFTVSKLGSVIAIALAVTPCGTRWSVDAWRRKQPAVELCSGGSVRFFQILLPVFYCSSGICKATGSWLSDRFVLWSHLHDSYQTPISRFAANHAPTFAWTVLQATTLAFEAGAPLWFALKWTRPYAVAYALLMHTMIGLMFGPVAWFALLMIILVVGAYIPVTWLQPSFGLIRRTAP